MYREIGFTVNTIDDIDFYADWYRRGRIFAGCEGEEDATLLLFYFSSEFDDYTISLIMNGEEVELEDNEYIIPSEYMKPEKIKMVIIL